jgi:hypothetical protein
MYECFYVYLKIKNDKNEGDVVAKLSAHMSKSRVRFSTQRPAEDQRGYKQRDVVYLESQCGGMGGGG